MEHHDTDGGPNLVFMDLVDIRVLSLYDKGYSQSYNLRGIWRLKQSYALETQKRLLGAERKILYWRNSDIEEAFIRVLQARPHVAAKIEEEFTRALQTRPCLAAKMKGPFTEGGGLQRKYLPPAKIKEGFC